jgi:hypothetical protein
MNMNTLSEWQVEVLREAFAMLAREEAARLSQSESSLSDLEPKPNHQRDEVLSFPI